MTTIYLVSSGEYSDYSIVAAFSTKALAEAFIKLQDGPPENEDGTQRYGSDHQIEEYELDVPFDPDGGAWRCVWRQSGVARYEPTVFWCANGNASTPATYNDGVFESFGKTPEHARRSARELWRQLKAEGTLKAPAPQDPAEQAEQNFTHYKTGGETP